MTDEQIVDVLTKPLARVKFEYSGRSLVFSRSRFPPRESDETHSHSDMVRGLVPSWSDVRAETFCHGERIGSFHVRYECWPFYRAGQM